MLDFLFRRGNPTNRWRRSSDLTLTAALHVPSLNGVTFGSRLDCLSFLGRNDNSQFGELCYIDLGIGVDHNDDGILYGYTIVLCDDEQMFQPYHGTIWWKTDRLELSELTQNNLPSIFGDWYWLDTDDDESIAFYEFRDYEMQIELAPSGRTKRIILTNSPLMSDANQRKAYNVKKTWPPEHGT